jgi:branched-chain amino acid transport system ATP-binding protein
MSEATTYLELRDLRVSYGKVEALHGISVHVEQGEIVTILGANGAGKTTTLTTISGLRKPSGGSILFQGRPLHTIPSHEIVRLGITQSPEGRRVFGTLSVRENLDLGAFTSKDRGRSAKIRKWIFDLFPRLAEREGQLAGTLSGGEQQMLAIARALMADPKVLLLDEPSLGLAPLLVRSINRQGVTVILVEQNARAALKLASRGYVIEVGRVVMEDASEALLANPDVQAAYLGGGQENGQEN